MLIDLSSYESIRNFVKNFTEKYDHLDVLINNAGLLKIKYVEAEGQETTITVNYTGTILLTSLLFEYLEKTPKIETDEKINGPRVVFVSSDAYKLAEKPFKMSKVKVEKTEKEWGWNEAFKRYAMSKFMLSVTVVDLVQKFKTKGSNITMNLVHPGWVKTDLGLNEVAAPVMKIFL